MIIDYSETQGRKYMGYRNFYMTWLGNSPRRQTLNRNQTEILQIKNAVCEIENTVEVLDNRIRKKKIYELGEKSFKYIYLLTSFKYILYIIVEGSLENHMAQIISDRELIPHFLCSS